jgi:ribosomal protein S27AE
VAKKQEESPEVRCGSCGFRIPGAEAIIEDALETIDGLERDLRVKRNTIKRLEGEAADRLERSKWYSAAVEVLTYWSVKLQPKAREIASKERLEPVIARLNANHTVEGLKKCVDGYALFPYVVNGKRMAQGPEACRHVKATTIFSSPDKVELGIAMSKRTVAAAIADTTDIRFIDWRKVRFANHRTILAALRKEGAVIYNESIRKHEATCPKCRKWLLVADPQDSFASLLECGGCGMNEQTFLAALVTTDLPPAVDEKTVEALRVLDELAEQHDMEVSV